MLGAHGGAGVTTVTRLLDPSRDGGAVELQPGSTLPHSYIPVVVARSTAYGLLKAGELLNRWHPGTPRPYLVLVRDAPLRPPLPARYRTRALSARTLGVATVPYLYRLRLVDTPEEALTHRPVARASSSLRSQLGATTN
ncbi:hypothetical protein AB0D22_35515 [Kitasatospora sp. NPDC048538]|uniref:hypothetical protein n=1 Tax=Kitasatospora sp. NPDC048538 TaxID=3155633 RepID=UPI00340654E9